MKRKDSNGKVTGTEKHQTFVKHGGTYIWVNPCHICHVKDEHPDNIDHRAINEVNEELVNNPKQTIEPHKEDDENFSMNKEKVNPGEEVTDD